MSQCLSRTFHSSVCSLRSFCREIHILAKLTPGKTFPAMTVRGVPCCSSYPERFSLLSFSLSWDVPPAALLTGPPKVGCAREKDTPDPREACCSSVVLPNGAHRPLGAKLCLNPNGVFSFQNHHGFTRRWLTPRPTSF